MAAKRKRDDLGRSSRSQHTPTVDSDPPSNWKLTDPRDIWWCRNLRVHGRNETEEKKKLLSIAKLQALYLLTPPPLLASIFSFLSPQLWQETCWGVCRAWWKIRLLPQAWSCAFKSDAGYVLAEKLPLSKIPALTHQVKSAMSPTACHWPIVQTFKNLQHLKLTYSLEYPDCKSLTLIHCGKCDELIREHAESLETLGICIQNGVMPVFSSTMSKLKKVLIVFSTNKSSYAVVGNLVKWVSKLDAFDIRIDSAPSDMSFPSLLSSLQHKVSKLRLGGMLSELCEDPVDPVDEKNKLPILFERFEDVTLSFGYDSTVAVPSWILGLHNLRCLTLSWSQCEAMSQSDQQQMQKTVETLCINFSTNEDEDRFRLIKFVLPNLLARCCNLKLFALKAHPLARPALQNPNLGLLRVLHDRKTPNPFSFAISLVTALVESDGESGQQAARKNFNLLQGISLSASSSSTPSTQASTSPLTLSAASIPTTLTGVKTRMDIGVWPQPIFYLDGLASYVGSVFPNPLGLQYWGVYTF